MDISDFTEVINKHPFGTFGKMEIESFMAWFLKQCIAAGDIDAVVKTKMNEDYLCDRDILIKVGEQQYRLTESSKKTLHNFYQRNFLEPSEFSL